MRFLDWDVLLFPTGEEGAHVPVKEFRTACYIEHLDNAAAQTPVLTAFVPTLAAGEPFQVSVHSWRNTGPLLTVPPNTLRPKELYQVKVVIDGDDVCTESFETDVHWPQVVATRTSPDGEKDSLRFPPFHRSIVSQSHWDASDKMGRIRIELSGGYLDTHFNIFKKVGTIVAFAFQLAPLELLEQSGIAWPNARMYNNPLQAGSLMGATTGVVSAPPPTAKHKIAASAGNIRFPHTIARMVPVQQPSTSPINPFAHEMSHNYDSSSRSTSAYSILPDSAAPLFSKGYPMQAYMGNPTEVARKAQHYPMRMPSDQFQMLLHAINPNQPPKTAPGTMPPPPLPAAIKRHPYPFNADSTLNGDAAHQDGPLIPLAPSPRQSFGPNLVSVMDRRAESRYSDVSMHNGCTSFPICTTEDEDGQIVHSTPSAPSTVVRGRKEGSSPAKPRDFFSTILDMSASHPTTTTMTMETPKAKEPGLLSSSPAETTGRKRTRSALRSLNINDGSPEKKDASKPPRKASRASEKPNNENGAEANEGQENMMVDG